MATVLDVAAYILKKQGEMTTWKLQKLVYYAQAWNLVWDEEELFDSPIQAWADGPVCPELYEAHKGRFKISHIVGRVSKLTTAQKETIDSVLKSYGKKDGQYLSELTHDEKPWKNARKGVEPGERSDNEITHEDMSEYYSSLLKRRKNK